MIRPENPAEHTHFLMDATVTDSARIVALETRLHLFERQLESLARELMQRHETSPSELRYYQFVQVPDQDPNIVTKIDFNNLILHLNTITGSIATRLSQLEAAASNFNSDMSETPNASTSLDDSRLRQLERILGEANRRIASLENRGSPALEPNRVAVRELGSEVLALQTSLNRHKEETQTRHEKDKRVAIQWYKTTKTNIKSFKASVRKKLKATEEENALLKSALHVLQCNHEAERKKREQLEKRIHDLEQTQQASQKLTAQTVKSHKTWVKNQLQDLTKGLASDATRSESLHSQQKGLEEQIRSLEQALQEFRKREKEVHDSLQKLRDSLKVPNKESTNIPELKKELEALRRRVSTLELASQTTQTPTSPRTTKEEKQAPSPSSKGPEPEVVPAPSAPLPAKVSAKPSSKGPEPEVVPAPSAPVPAKVAARPAMLEELALQAQKHFQVPGDASLLVYKMGVYQGRQCTKKLGGKELTDFLKEMEVHQHLPWKKLLHQMELKRAYPVLHIQSLHYKASYNLLNSLSEGALVFLEILPAKITP